MPAKTISADEANEQGVVCGEGHKGNWKPLRPGTNHPCRYCMDCRRIQRRLSKYKLDHKTYEMMVSHQGGLCFICKEPKPLVVDHDHKTGMVRALVCYSCNTLVGGIENPLAERAQVYVELFKEQLITWQQAPKPKAGSIA